MMFQKGITALFISHNPLFLIMQSNNVPIIDEVNCFIRIINIYYRQYRSKYLILHDGIR